MKVKKMSGNNQYEIKGLTLGKLLAIRNGLGYAKRGGFITPLQEEAFDEIGAALESLGEKVDPVETDPKAFLKERYNIE